MHHKGHPPKSMMAFGILNALMIKILIWFPMALIGLLIIPIMLLSGWDGKNGPWGNVKHTKENPRWNGFWSAWHYLAIRNAVSNFSHEFLAYPVNTMEPSNIWGFIGVTDGPPGIEGWYYIECCGAFEYRLVQKTLPGRCLEIRIGWKLKGLVGKDNDYLPAAYVFRLNPVRKFG